MPFLEWAYINLKSHLGLVMLMEYLKATTVGRLKAEICAEKGLIYLIAY